MGFLRYKKKIDENQQIFWVKKMWGRGLFTFPWAGQGKGRLEQGNFKWVRVEHFVLVFFFFQIEKMQGTQELGHEETKSVGRQLLEATEQGLLETVEQLLCCKEIDVNFQDEVSGKV